jgi:signal transduction histidine kinase
MGQPRSRLSHRHLFALGTFLVPLAALALLGWNELQRSGNAAQQALANEGRQFLASARQAIEQQLDSALPRLLAESQRLLIERGPVKTTLQLREQPEFEPLRSIVLLDEQFGVEWPRLAVYSVSLPFARDGRRGIEGPVSSALQGADLLLSHGKLPEAIGLLRHIATQFAAANPPGRDRSSELVEGEILARFRLATALRKTRDRGAARAEFERVRDIVAELGNSLWLGSELPVLALLAESELAALGDPEDRLQLLRSIAANKYDTIADGLLSALAQRLADHFDDEDPAHAEVVRLLGEEQQRAYTRTFAATYDLVLKYGLRLRRSRQPAVDSKPAREERLVATIGGETLLLAVRPATHEEQSRWKCAWVGLHIDLVRLLSPTLRQFAGDTRTFALAVTDADAAAGDAPILPPPPAVPADFEPPTSETNGLLLRAYPADPARFAADAEAAASTRTLMLVAVFVTALGGALWSWRSVSREAELAQLKVDLVSRVSHELKTPLALIRMYGETLGMGRARDSGQAAEFGSIIARESERLTALIQRILDFSRQQAGTLSYAPQPVDLGELLRTVADSYAPHLEARGVMLIDSLPFGIRVNCDANAAESAIVNLLENAAKYGPDGDGEHELELDLVALDGRAIVEVRDRGRGIPPDEVDRVFEGFYRASNSGEVRGAGLGLSLVRHFARAHGGDIEALPRQGGGTVMRLTLPLASDPPPGTTGSGGATPP